MNEQTLKKIESLVKKTCSEYGYDYISTSFKNDSLQGNILEILIDKNYDISLDDITTFSSIINPLIDEIDDSDESYILDISSGGYERKIPLSDLDKLIDRFLHIKLATKEVSARLVSVYDDKIDVVYFIKGRKKKESILLSDIEEIHMEYKA